MGPKGRREKAGGKERQSNLCFASVKREKRHCRKKGKHPSGKRKMRREKIPEATKKVAEGFP